MFALVSIQITLFFPTDENSEHCNDSRAKEELKRGFLLTSDKKARSETKYLDLRRWMKDLWWLRPAWFLPPIMNAHLTKLGSIAADELDR